MPTDFNKNIFNSWNITVRYTIDWKEKKKKRKETEQEANEQEGGGVFSDWNY